MMNTVDDSDDVLQAQAEDIEAPPITPLAPEPHTGCGRSPFDCRSGGDCCLFTSDRKIFFAYQNILSLASPVFADMLRTARYGPGNYPTIDVCVTANVLDALLRCIYPIRRRPVNNIGFAVSLTLAANRYHIAPRLLPLHAFLLHNKTALSSEPETVYALSWNLGYEDAAQVASRHAVLIDLTDIKVKNRIMECAKDYEAILALCELRQKQMEHMQEIVCAIPLEGMLIHCNKRKTNTDHLTKLVDAVKMAFSVPNIREEDVKIKAIFSQVCEDCSEFTDSVISTCFDAYYEAVKSFPRTIIWPKHKPCLFSADE